MFVSDSDGISSEGRNLLRTQFDRKCSLFYVELPGGTILSHAIEESEKFPAQFGREVRLLIFSHSTKNPSICSSTRNVNVLFVFSMNCKLPCSLPFVIYLLVVPLMGIFKKKSNECLILFSSSADWS